MINKEYWELYFPGDGSYVPRKLMYRYTVIIEDGRYFKEDIGYSDESLKGDEVFLTEQDAWERIVQNAEEDFNNAEERLLKTVERAESAGWDRK